MSSKTQHHDDTAGGGGCFGCFGGKKKKTAQQPANPPANNPKPPAPTSPFVQVKPGTDVPPPSFITQVDKKGGPPVKKLSINPGANMDDRIGQSPRGRVIPNQTKEQYTSYPASDRPPVSDGEKCPWRSDALLPPQRPNKKGKKCLILDLDETLVHSSFKEVPVYDFLIPVEIDGVTYQVYVAKRPHVDEFMKKMGECYEICVFTASLAKYADPVLDLLDKHKVVDWRLFRESCTCIKNTYVKDMGRMGRPLKSVMIMDNSPHSYSFNPENAIPCESWFDDYQDRELLDFIPVLQGIADSSVDNVIDELARLKINGVQRLLESMESSDSGSTSNEVYTESSDSGN